MSRGRARPAGVAPAAGTASRGELTDLSGAIMVFAAGVFAPFYRIPGLTGMTPLPHESRLPGTVKLRGIFRLPVKVGRTRCR